MQNNQLVRAAIVGCQLPAHTGLNTEGSNPKTADKSVDGFRASRSVERPRRYYTDCQVMVSNADASSASQVDRNAVSEAITDTPRRFERKHLPVTIPVSSETRRYRPHQGHLERQPTKGTCHEIVLRAIFGDTEDQRHKSGELTGETGARKSQNRIAPTDDVVAVQCRLEVQR